MPIGLANQLYNPENPKMERESVLGPKKGLAGFGETFEIRVKKANLERKQAFGIELVYIVIATSVVNRSVTVLET
jgi:type I restriction-modification system DNA methylase subunit